MIVIKVWVGKIWMGKKEMVFGIGDRGVYEGGFIGFMMELDLF